MNTYTVTFETDCAVAVVKRFQITLSSTHASRAIEDAKKHVDLHPYYGYRAGVEKS